MYRNQILTLMGMYKYRHDLFDTCVFPADVSRETILNNLLLESAALEVVYLEADFLKNALGVFCAAQLATWEHLYKTTMYEYDPIYNYDRREETTTKGTASGSDNSSSKTTAHGDSTLERNLTDNTVIDGTGTTESTLQRELQDTEKETRNLAGSKNRTLDTHTTNNRTPNLSQTVKGTDTTKDSNNDSTAYSVAAFNQSQGMVDSEKQVLTYGKEQKLTTDRTETQSGSDNTTGSNTGTDNLAITDKGDITRNKTYGGSETNNGSSTEKRTENTTAGGSETTTNKGTSETTAEGTHSEQDERTTTTRAYGNIGVTTTQQLIEAERELALFNIINYICRDIINKFCIEVY